MGETRKMDFGIGELTKKLEQIADNYDTDKLKEATKDINDATKGINEMTKAAKEFNKEASKKIPKRDENFLKKYKSFSKKEALDKIDKASNLGGVDLVQMVNAYRAQFDDFEKLTEKEFKNIVKIREKYNKFIATNLTKEGKQSYSDEIYSLSPAKIKEKLDKYPDWKAPSVDIKVNFEVNEDSLKVVNERKQKLINELNKLDKGREEIKETRYDGTESITITEKTLHDRNTLKAFVQYYTELESIIKDFGGEIPDRIQQIYSAIEKANIDGALKIKGSMDDGIKSYNKFKKDLKKDIADNTDLNKSLDEFADDYVEKFEKLRNKILSIAEKIDKASGENIRKKFTGEDYYTTKIDTLEDYINSLHTFQEELKALKEAGMTDEDNSSADSYLKMLELSEIIAQDKIESIRKVYQSIDWEEREAQKKRLESIQETENLIREFRARVFNNKDWWHGTDYSDEELEEYMDKIRNGFTDIDALYNDLSNKIEVRMQRENEEYDFSADPDNFEETEEGLDHVDEKVNDTIADTEKLVEALKSLTEEVSKISKSIGTIDEESGVGNLISQFSNLISKIEELQETINGIDFNVTIEQPDAEEDFWRKELSRVKGKYTNVLKQSGGLEKLIGELYNTSFEGSMEDIQEVFSTKSLEDAKTSKDKLINYLNFFRYLKEVRQNIQGYIDSAKVDLEEAKKGLKKAELDGNEELQRRFENQIKIANNTINDAFYNAVLNSTKSLPSSNINDYIKRNKEQLTSQENIQVATATINSVLNNGNNTENVNLQHQFGDLTPVITDLKTIQDLLEKISDNKGFSETISNITIKLDSMQQSFRDLIRNLNDTIKNMTVATTEKITDTTQEQSMVTLIGELKDMAGGINILPTIPKPIDFIKKINELLENYFATINIKPEFKTEEFINQVDNLISSEETKFSDLAKYISEKIPEAIEVKNKAFKEEEGIVSQIVENEINKIRELERELSENISGVISETTNSNLNRQLEVVNSEGTNSNIEEIILNEEKLKETSTSVAEAIAKEYKITGKTIEKLSEQIQYLFKSMAKGGSFDINGILEVLANYGHIKENSKLLHSDYYGIRESVSNSNIKISYGDAAEFGDEWNKVRSTIGLKNITSTGVDATVILRDLHENFGHVLKDANTTQEAIRVLYEYLRDNKPDLVSDFIETEELTDGINHLKSSLLEAFNTIKEFREESDKIKSNIKDILVYRGTNGNNPVTANASGATFWTNKKENARLYGTNGEDKSLYSALISMQNPLEIDAKGAKYGHITYLGEGIDETSKRIIELTKRAEECRQGLLELQSADESDTEAMQKAVNIGLEYNKVLREIKEISDDLNNPYGTHSTDWFGDYAKNHGYDGVHFKNVRDTPDAYTEEVEPSDVYITFQKEQLKNIKLLERANRALVDSQEEVNISQERNIASINHVEEAIKVIQEEGQAAEKAAEQKLEFVSANEKVSESGTETADNIQSASESILEEGQAAEKSTSTMDDAFDKIQDSIKRVLGEQEEFTENNEDLGKSALATAEKLEEEMDVADALFNVLTTRSKTLVDVDGEAYKLEAGKKFTAQTVAGRKVSMTAIPRKDEEGNLLGYATVIDQQTDYMKIVNQAAKAVKDLQKAEHDRAIQLQKNPDSENIKEYDNLIAEAKQRLDAATVAARKFAKENEIFINDTKYSSKYLMSIFNRNVAQAVAADTSKENIRYNKAVESTQKQAEKQIEAVNNKLSQQKILVDAIQHSYDESVAPGVSKPVTQEKDLVELETRRKSILTEISRLQNNPEVTEEDLRLLRESVAQYKQLAKDKKNSNNPTKREMGGQKLDVAIQQELAAYDKVLDRARQYGDLTEDITTSLEEQRKILEEKKNIDTLYNSQDYRKALDARLKSFEIAEKRKKIEAQSKERGEVLSNKQLIAVNELIEKEQELKELGLYTDEVADKLDHLLGLAASPGKFTGLSKFRTEFKLFNQDMKDEIQKRKKEIKEEEKANQPKKESTKVTDEEKLNQVYDDLIRKYQDLLSLKQKLRATSEGEDTQILEADIKNIEKDITNLERRRHTLTDKGIDNTDKLNSYLNSIKQYTTYEDQFLSTQGLVNETYTQEIKNLKEIDRLRKRNVTVAGKEIGEEEVRNKELINVLLEENNELEKKRNSILEDNNSDVKENVVLQDQLNKKLEQSQKIEEETNLKTNEKLNNQVYNKIKSLDKLDKNKYIGKAKTELEILQKYIADIRSKPIEFTSDEGIDKLNKINNLFNNFQKHRNASEFLTANENMLRKLEQKIQSFQQKNSGMGSEFMKQFEDLKLKITPEMSKEDATNLANEFIKLQTEVTKADKLGKSFFRTIGEHLKSINAQFIAQYFSFQDLLRYARSAFEAVRQLDTALVDLKKTTTMNNTDLEEFYINSSKIAKETGVTTQEIITQAAAWSRLGFSSKEAAETMAELSSQFAKISPGTSVEDATDYLVSTMKAFHIDVADVESEIMDSINRIGNTMATSNSEVGEMLKRSSAAMAEANNTLAETIALESAAVQITRNAETTGTAFRTISMRIRGYDEETEELSEDLENISGDIADLTKTASKPGGISLFSDSAKTTYKSTYELLKEISLIYHDLTDKQQAALLEKLAGKRGGQVLAGRYIYLNIQKCI